MNDDILYVLQSIELEKAKGQLNALVSSKYNPMGNNEDYKEIKELVNKFIKDLENYF